MEDNGLANIGREDDRAFKSFDVPAENTDNKETTTPSTPPVENKSETEKPSQGGDNTPDVNIPFNKHPRWVEKEREIDELRSTVSELSQFREQMESKQFNQGDAAVNLPQWWKTLYGNDPVAQQAYREYQQHEASSKEEFKREALEEIQNKEQAYHQEVSKWEGYINNQLQDLRDQGLKFDKDELLKVVDEYSPKDESGNLLGGFIDFGRAYDILQLKKQSKQDPAKDRARKDIASQTTSNNRGEAVPNKTHSVGSLARKGWGDWQGNY